MLCSDIIIYLFIIMRIVSGTTYIDTHIYLYIYHNLFSERKQLLNIPYAVTTVLLSFFIRSLTIFLIFLNIASQIHWRFIKGNEQMTKWVYNIQQIFQIIFANPKSEYKIFGYTLVLPLKLSSFRLKRDKKCWGVAIFYKIISFSGSTVDNR